MKYGFIGAGNIARAIITGALRSGKVEESQFYVHDIDRLEQHAFEKMFGAVGCGGLHELLGEVDIALLAVKPNVYHSLLPGVADTIRRHGGLLVSLAAGYTLDSVEHMGGCTGLPIARVMPNVNAAVCEAVSAVCVNTHVSSTQKQHLLQLFNLTGMTIEIEERMFGIFSAIAGCSPAYTYMFVNALAMGALKQGMSKKRALQIAAQAVMGSAKMMLESKEHPWELVEKVCSPGGVTIEGVCTLEEHQFETAVINAVEASVRKDVSIRS